MRSLGAEPCVRDLPATIVAGCGQKLIGGRPARLALRSSCWRAVAVALALLFAPSARAQQAGLGLNWVRLPGAESCVTATQLMNGLEQRVGRILFVRSGEAVLSIDGYVYPVETPRGWSVTLELNDARGTVLGHRELGVLPGDDCQVVADAVQLILDLTLDPDDSLHSGIPLAPETRRALDELLHADAPDPDPNSLPSAPARAPAPAPPPPPPPRADRQEPLPAAERAEPREGDAPAFDATALVALGARPGAAFGLALHTSLPTRIGWRVELGVAAEPEQRAGDGDARAGFQLLLGSLALCPWQPFDGFGLCAGAEYGTQRVAPSALAQAQPASESLVDVLGYAGWRVGLFGPLVLQARAGAVVPLIRNRYAYRSPGGVRTLYRTAPVGARVELGLGLQL